jgi:ABC-type branched-subunit amino acid transport system ATPase component
VSAVAFDGLSVSLGGTEVLHGVSAAVESGEWVAVIGAIGAG